MYRGIPNKLKYNNFIYTFKMSKEESEPSPLIPNDSSDPQLIPTIPPPLSSKTNYTKIILGLLIGQLLSILSVLNGLCSQYLETKKNLVIPLLLTSSYYFLLFITWIITTREIHKPKLIYISHIQLLIDHFILGNRKFSIFSDNHLNMNYYV